MAGDRTQVKITIDKFDGTDFAYWKMQIEDLLYQKNLYLPLSTKPAGMKDEEWELLDRQALGQVRLMLARNVAFNIVKEKTTAGLMKALANMYEKPTANNKVYLMRKLFNLKMQEGASVANHLNEFNSIISQLSTVKIDFEDEVKALIILSSLPRSWDGTVTAVSSTSGSDKLSFADVRDLILSEEIRKKGSTEASDSSAFYVGGGRKGNNGKSKNRRKGKSQMSHEGENGEGCWNCGKPGHWARDCKNQGNQGESNAVVSDGSGCVLVLGTTDPEGSWVLDSAAISHCTSHHETIENFVSGDFGKIRVGNGEPLKIVGKGDVTLGLEGGDTLKIHDVGYVPGLKWNVISIGRLDDEGFEVRFGGGSWRITKGATEIARGLKVGTMYATKTNGKPKLCDASAGLAA